ncbi:MAG: methyltransferase type 11 [Parcubacteria group bacterium Gr01-1014_18]|nr:MAG: methyltransferase type 11 [Parcubacteria group bacterium Greene0416_36]TSC81570.1 MAG: methyltransferase type 11 [Parcubacteria group bacterium Gr01-1014_18]TSC99619.1 MAG: methyltransferase type 11 [Parcubacteria group bacterium Greene1014_20]TSD07070.1 MAG: methyltransferase type 11 [Parcubacteria group bacterium Greene0714_2]
MRANNDALRNVFRLLCFRVNCQFWSLRERGNWANLRALEYHDLFMSTDPKTIAWYNDNSQQYSEHVRNPEESLYHAYYEKPAMYALLPDLKGKKVLSLACGSGEDSHYLKTMGAEISCGIGISEKLIKIAKFSYSDCDFKVMDMEKLDFYWFFLYHRSIN